MYSIRSASRVRTEALLQRRRKEYNDDKWRILEKRKMSDVSLRRHTGTTAWW
jgi:hypothetical protein